MKFQYIGMGDSPPQNIVFMGRVSFVLNGEPVEVTDKELVAKLKYNPCFVSEEAASDPEGDYQANLDDEIPEIEPIIDDPEVADPEILSDYVQEESSDIDEEFQPESTVPVVTTYARPRGRPKTKA